MKEYRGGDFLADFALISAIHQIEMISFIKFFPVIRFFLLQRRLCEVSCFVSGLNCLQILILLICITEICVGVFFFLGCR